MYRRMHAEITLRNDTRRVIGFVFYVAAEDRQFFRKDIRYTKNRKWKLYITYYDKIKKKKKLNIQRQKTIVRLFNLNRTVMIINCKHFISS